RRGLRGVVREAAGARLGAGGVARSAGHHAGLRASRESVREGRARPGRGRRAGGACRRAVRRGDRRSRGRWREGRGDAARPGGRGRRDQRACASARRRRQGDPGRGRSRQTGDAFRTGLSAHAGTAFASPHFARRRKSWVPCQPVESFTGFERRSVPKGSVLIGARGRLAYGAAVATAPAPVASTVSETRRLSRPWSPLAPLATWRLLSSP